MDYVAMIQARCGSSRLPNKILMDLCGKPVLQRVIERVRKSKYVDEAIVVTSIEPQNLQVMKLCADLGVRVFAGSENDVLDRYYQMAKLLQPKYVIRVTADCPCYDWTILDAAIESMPVDTDYCSDFGETLPDGFDIEIMKFSSLQTAWQEAKLDSEREHVTQFIRKHPERFVHHDFKCAIDHVGRLRLTLDESEDYKLIEAVYLHFKDNAEFLLPDVVSFLDKNPELMKINAKYARNEGLAKSIQNDKQAEII